MTRHYTLIVEVPDDSPVDGYRLMRALWETIEPGSSTHCREVTYSDGSTIEVREHHHRLDVTVGYGVTER